MTAIKRSKDCGNSPKNMLVQDIAIALEIGQTPDALHDDVIWRRTRRTTLEGKAAVYAALKRSAAPSVLTIEHAITHGKVGMASGQVRAGGRTRRFCHVIAFASAKGDRIATITSYLA